MESGFNIAGLGSDSGQPNFLASRRFDYYVDGALGSDSNNGSIHSPFRTIQRAVNAADESNNPGENNVYINPGRYFENVFISDEDLVRLIGRTHNPYDVVIDGDGTAPIDIEGGHVELKYLRTTDGFNGIVGENMYRLDLHHVVSNFNEDDGLDVENTNKVYVSHSKFEKNGDDGVDIYEVNKFHATHSYFDNNEQGLQLFDVGRAEVLYSKARYNRDDGFDVDGGHNVRVIGSYFLDNNDDGADIDNVNYSWFEATHFKDNGENGLEGFENRMVFLIGSISVRNGDLADDGTQVLQQVDDSEIFRGNGVALQTTDYVKVSGGAYSDNVHDGILMELVNYADLYGVGAMSNGDDGVDAFGFGRVAVRNGVFSENNDDGLDFQGEVAVNGGGSDLQALTTGNGDGEKVDIVGGLYWDNGSQGIEIDNVDNVYMAAVNAQRNGVDGVDVDFAEKTMVANSYSAWNGDDGFSFDNIGMVHVHHVTAKHNDEDGMDVDVAGTVNVSGGLFWYNGEDGLDLDGDQLDPLIGEINQVNIWHTSASHNGYNGLSLFNVNYAWVTGGSFLHNQRNGLRFVDTNNVWVKDAVATHNRRNGLYVEGIEVFEPLAESSGQGQPMVRIIRGSYNHNYEDGLHMISVGGVWLNHVNAIANRDDGLFVAGANFVNRNGGTYVANGNRNIYIDLY